MSHNNYLPNENDQEKLDYENFQRGIAEQSGTAVNNSTVTNSTVNMNNISYYPSGMQPSLSPNFSQSNYHQQQQQPHYYQPHVSPLPMHQPLPPHLDYCMQQMPNVQPYPSNPQMYSQHILYSKPPTTLNPHPMFVLYYY